MPMVYSINVEPINYAKANNKTKILHKNKEK